MDVVCFEDLDLFGRETSSELDELEQDLYHRLLERYGSNPDDLERGLGLRARLSGPVDPDIRLRAEEEVRRDDRVAAARATIVEVDDGLYRLEMEVEASGQLLGIGVDLEQADVARQT